METKDFVSIAFSTVSLALSLGTLYLTQFRSSNVTVTTGPMIHLFYTVPTEPTIFLPVVFHNASPTKAIIYKAFLEIQDTKNENFALKWIGSVKIDLSNNYTNTELAGPFKIDGYETIPNALRFFWVNGDQNQQLNWLEGEYKLKLHIWTSSSAKPTYTHTDRLTINSEVARLMAEKKQNSDNTSRFIPLAGKALLSFSTGKNPINFSTDPER